MLHEMGFTDLWLPPCSQSVAPQAACPQQGATPCDSACLSCTCAVAGLPALPALQPGWIQVRLPSVPGSPAGEVPQAWHALPGRHRHQPPARDSAARPLSCLSPAQALRCGDKQGKDGKWNQFSSGMTTRRCGLRTVVGQRCPFLRGLASRVSVIGVAGPSPLETSTPTAADARTARLESVRGFCCRG